MQALLLSSCFGGCGCRALYKIAESHNFILSKRIENRSWVIHHGNTRDREGDEEAEKATLSLSRGAGRVPTAAAAAGGQGGPDMGMEGLLGEGHLMKTITVRTVPPQEVR